MMHGCTTIWERRYGLRENSKRNRATGRKCLNEFWPSLKPLHRPTLRGIESIETISFKLDKIARRRMCYFWLRNEHLLRAMLHRNPGRKASGRKNEKGRRISKDSEDSRPVERRGRDSNPRYRFTPYTGLANRRIRPLCHLSNDVLTRNRLKPFAYVAHISGKSNGRPTPSLT